MFSLNVLLHVGAAGFIIALYKSPCIHLLRAAWIQVRKKCIKDEGPCLLLSKKKKQFSTWIVLICNIFRVFRLKKKIFISQVIIKFWRPESHSGRQTMLQQDKVIMSAENTPPPHQKIGSLNINTMQLKSRFRKWIRRIEQNKSDKMTGRTGGSAVAGR